MKSWRYRVATVATCSGLFVGLAVAAPPDGQLQEAPVAVAAQAPVKAQQAPPVPAQAGPKARVNWDALGMRGFSVALVLGDLAGAATPDNLPAGAKKALSDMRDFLPYKSYRLLDTHWILCCSGPIDPSVSGRLRGADEQEYAFNIDVHPLPGTSSELSVRFNLREMAFPAERLMTGVHPADRAQQVNDLKHLRQEIERRAGQSANPAEEAAARTQVEVVKRKQTELERAAQTRVTTARSGSVLDSTFSMKVGETVVIGTSRLKGEKALIALLTAASRDTTSPPAR